MKYELAYSNRHNCTNPSGHCFYPVTKEERKEIINEHPGFGRTIVAIWKCSHCGKVMQSM